MDDNELVETVDDNDEDESKFEGTTSLAHLARECTELLSDLARAEESNAQDASQDLYWASRQWAEYNVWCNNVGTRGEGVRSVDVRLKDVPEICKLLGSLLRYLRHDLQALQRPPSKGQSHVEDDVKDNDSASDTSSISFDSLSSSDGSADDPLFGWHETRNAKNDKLRTHIGDTIDRLQQLARQIQRASAQHRRQRVDLYREKEKPRQVYEGFEKLGRWKADSTFKLATDATKERTAQSFARRRIRLEYLKAHQKKIAVQRVVSQDQSMAALETIPEQMGIDPIPNRSKAPQRTHPGATAPYPEDQKTIFSATVNTQFDFGRVLKAAQRPESVRSVAIRSTGFPPPPQIDNGIFQCPYCRLTFGAREAEPDRWNQHVMQDFEPYFCTFQDCIMPFDVPNSFDGLLDHMQTHVPVRLHVEQPDGDHQELLDNEFEDHVQRLGGVDSELMITLKEDSRRRGAFLFNECPFCGGYPDILETRFPDPTTMEAQIELRRHVKQHMQEIALFMPPYRSDIADDDEETKDSDFAERQSAQEHMPESTDDFVLLCDNADCDCKDTETAWTEPVPEATDQGVSQQYWAQLLDDGGLYNRSSPTNQDFWDDECLHTFIAFAAVQALSAKGLDCDWFLKKGSAYVPDVQRSLLSGAIEHEDEGQSIAVVAQLLLQGADINVRDETYSSVLSKAIVSGKYDLANFLIRNGADFEAKDSMGRTPLALALDTSSHQDYSNVLHHASRSGKDLADPDAVRKLIKTLITAGASLKSKDNEGRTPLAIAAESGTSLFTEGLLLTDGATIETRDNHGRSPLALAVRKNCFHNVKALVNYGADINAADHNGVTPLMEASSAGFEKIKAFLITSDAIPESKHEMNHMGLWVEASQSQETGSTDDTNTETVLGPKALNAGRADSLSTDTTRSAQGSSPDESRGPPRTPQDENTDPETGGHTKVRSINDLPFESTSDLGRGQRGVPSDRPPTTQEEVAVPTIDRLKESESEKSSEVVSEDLLEEHKITSTLPKQPSSPTIEPSGLSAPKGSWSIRGDDDTSKRQIEAGREGADQIPIQRADTRFEMKHLQDAFLHQSGTSLDTATATMCIRMFSLEKDDFALSEEEMQGALSFLSAWRGLFERFLETAESASMSRKSFANALIAFGYRISDQFLDLLYDSFAQISDEGVESAQLPRVLPWDRFVQACITLKRGTDVFKEFDEDRDGYVTLGFEDFLDSLVRLRPLPGEVPLTDTNAVHRRLDHINPLHGLPESSSAPNTWYMSRMKDLSLLSSDRQSHSPRP